MNIQDIRLVYEYNYWANKRILAQCKNITQEKFIASAEFPYGGLRGTVVHILEAEWGWRTRFQNLGVASEMLATEFPTLTALESRWGEEEKTMRTYLASLQDEDMNSHVRYPIDNGEIRDRILWHCLVHVVNHGTQHRSEAAALLTRLGQSPGDLDFTVFLNQYKP
ncbi:MAG: DinB family protein [Limisphaerales bacterium]